MGGTFAVKELMENRLEKWRNDENALDAERRLMNEALALLGQANGKHVGGRSAGRLVFALDLTGSREASLRQARIATSAMFETIKDVGSVAVKLVYYRGAKECRASEWQDDPDVLCRSMLGLSCSTGGTQIARVLKMVLGETEGVSAVVFVGDHCEDDPDKVLKLAETLGQKSIRYLFFMNARMAINRPWMPSRCSNAWPKSVAASIASSRAIPAPSCVSCCRAWRRFRRQE